MPTTPHVDVVVVSYNSSATLADCVGPLRGVDRVNVIVVDNASADGSVASVAGLGVHVLALDTNRGFACGCNRGLEAGVAPFVLFLNPDARIEPTAVRQLVEVLEAHPASGLVGPRVIDESGSLDHSQRRFPRLRSTYARALFLHRIFPRSSWSDEVVRDPRAYETLHSVEWLSGACMLGRRTALEYVGGWNESFFMYGEDKDLCRRMWDAGYEVLYTPDAVAVHIGGASAPRDRLLPTLAASTIRYAHGSQTPVGATLTRAGVALGALTHAALTTKGRRVRLGHLKAFRVACSRLPREHASYVPASAAHPDRGEGASLR